MVTAVDTGLLDSMRACLMVLQGACREDVQQGRAACWETMLSPIGTPFDFKHLQEIPNLIFGLAIPLPHAK